MAGECKYDHWETAQSWDWTCPVDYTNRATIRHCIALDEVIDDQDDQIGH